MEIIGHRGASFDAPENTLASVRLAWEQGADGVEIDVRLTRDGQVMAFHDETVRRTAGGGDAAVPSLTLDELRRLDVGSWKHSRYAGERVATLAEILETVPSGRRLFIEIKAGLEIVPELVRVLTTAATLPEQTVLIAFSLDVLREMKARLPDRRACWIVSLRRDEQTGAWLPAAEEIAHRATEAGMDGVDIGCSPAIEENYVEPLRRAGLELYVWTVNTAEEARRFERLGFDGVATDRPGWLRGKLRGGE